MKNTATLLITCPDTRGIVAAIADCLYQHNANILHADQHQDAENNLFLMRVQWDLENFNLDEASFNAAFAPIAAKVTGWHGILIGDMAQPRGGPLPFGHKSHQIGLDVDICKAITATLLSDASKIKWVPLNAAQRFAALQLPQDSSKHRPQRVRDHGIEPLPPIIAPGAQGADPHEHGSGSIRAGEPIVLPTRLIERSSTARRR